MQNRVSIGQNQVEEGAGGGIDHRPEPVQPVRIRYGHRLYAGDPVLDGIQPGRHGTLH